MQNAPVLAGTRIPTSAIREFAAAGYNTAAILREYPTLTAKDVAAALSITLHVGETSRPAGGTQNVAAYDKYLLARSLAGRFNLAETLKARQVYHEALALDPNFALAWVGLHATLYNLMFLAPEDPQFVSYSAVARQEMTEASIHIASLAPDAWWTKAMQARQYMAEHEWLQAERVARAAIDAAPASEVDPLNVYADVLAAVGRIREALEYTERAHQLDPLSLEVSGRLQGTLGIVGRRADREAEYQRCKDLPGNHTIWDWWEMWWTWKQDKPDLSAVEALLRAYLTHESLPMKLSREVADTLHDPAAARAAIRRAFDDPANRDGARIGLIALYASHYDERDIEIAALRKQFLEYRDINFVTLWLTSTGAQRTDARFKSLVGDMKLVDYWRTSGHWADFCRPVGESDFTCN